MQAEKDILDFIVIGAQKSGTTSLFRHLIQHPEISLPPGKERPYFSHDEVYARGWGAYMRSLTRHDAFADPVRSWGTVTPQYMVGGLYQSNGDAAESYDERTVPLRINETLPSVHLIAILRDPVERALSHHRMLAMRGLERRSFDDAIGDLLHPDALDKSRRRPQERTGYIHVGESTTIYRYFDRLPSRRQFGVSPMNWSALPHIS